MGAGEDLYLLRKEETQEIARERGQKRAEERHSEQGTDK